MHVVSKISLVSVVSDEIISHLVLIENQVVSEFSDATIFHIVFQISIVSVVSDEFLFRVVFNISVVSVVSDKLFFMSGVRVVTKKCFYV